jgi:hypothetical protein
MFQPHLKYTLKFCHTSTSRSRSFITTLFHSSVHFFPVLVKGLYQTGSYSLHREKKNILDRQHIASQWGLQLIFRMHNSDPTPEGVENRNILLWFNAY